MAHKESLILYSFRRCPYAMRARLALIYAGIEVELREILLKDKPSSMLAISAKGTVPVLQLSNDQVINESIDILHWALAINDPDNWRLNDDLSLQQQAIELVAANDSEFKTQLDRYKYADRFPENPAQVYRDAACAYLQRLENLLKENYYLLTPHISWADIAIFPFIRQFAAVDRAWFDQTPYPRLQAWLEDFLDSPLFKQCMVKYSLWQTGDTPTMLHSIRP
jgi:glutathione S-transferase